MFDLFPTEISVYIARLAANENIELDRTTVYNLARASRTLFSIVSPILYHTFVAHWRNEHAIEELLKTVDNGAVVGERVFKLVRCLVIVHYTCRSHRYQCGTCLYIHMGHIEVFLGQPYNLRGFLCHNLKPPRLSKAILGNDGLPGVTIPASSTHVSLLVSRHNAVERILGWLGKGTNVQHLAIDVRDVVTANWLYIIVDAILFAHPGIYFSVRLAGEAVFVTETEQDEIVSTLQAIASARNGSKIFLWWDTRRWQLLKSDSQFMTCDAHAGRDVWSEARPIQSFARVKSKQASTSPSDSDSPYGIRALQPPANIWRIGSRLTCSEVAPEHHKRG